MCEILVPPLRGSLAFAIIHAMRKIAAVSLLLWLTSSSLIAQKPVVVALSTGGTIASKHDPQREVTFPLSPEKNLLRRFPRSIKSRRIHVEQISNISSSDMTPEIWVRLAARVNARGLPSDSLRAMNF
jgi:L-asparaginase/Glu-tRNA(Gln) amidotransferase subunit D